MLKALELESIDGLFRHLPDALKLDRVDLPEPLSEVELVQYMRELGRLDGHRARARTHVPDDASRLNTELVAIMKDPAMQALPVNGATATVTIQ